LRRRAGNGGSRRHKVALRAGVTESTLPRTHSAPPTQADCWVRGRHCRNRVTSSARHHMHSIVLIEPVRSCGRHADQSWYSYRPQY
jgi:hypothetical protein